MNSLPLYPASPSGVPQELTKAKASYKRQAMYAMAGLLVFMLLYIALMVCFGFISYQGFLALNSVFDLVTLFISVVSLMLAVFMAKSLFAVRKSGDPRGIEVTAEQEPKLFEFLNTLADEVGAPKPHRVFLTPEVNAAVFYDLSLWNLLFPSKKNLIVGLGLVNVLNLGEFKAVLAHEFGHFAQGSMMVGRWVYIAQQIIGHMVATRDWLDKTVSFISRIDLRIAWVGWLLSLVMWAMRSVVDTLFRVVIIAERALSREMEFNADLVAVSVTGSDALVNALHKLQAADHAWQTALNIAGREAGSGKLVDDLFLAQQEAINQLRRVMADDTYGATPVLPAENLRPAHRVFDADSARPPQMWATHPANRDREDNAKSVYVPAEIDSRSAWLVFSDAQAIRNKVSVDIFNTEKAKEWEKTCPQQAVQARFSRASYSPEYRGTYLNRSWARNFDSVEDIYSFGSEKASAKESLADIYPQSLRDDLEAARSLDIERSTLQALASGELKPSGGIIRHRGEELKKGDIPNAIAAISKERKVVADRLKLHDACCRRAHLQAAKELGQDWDVYLQSLVALVHCTEHLSAKVEDELAFMVNTWQVITADGQIGFFEKRRMLKTCNSVQAVMEEVSVALAKITLPAAILEEIGIHSWSKECPKFELVDVNKKNWGQWCPAAAEQMENINHALSVLNNIALETLITTEAELKQHIEQGTQPSKAPYPGAAPRNHPKLMPGDEHVLQRKLDLWNRFQLAHGLAPTLARLLVSMGIVGGTIYSGVMFI